MKKRYSEEQIIGFLKETEERRQSALSMRRVKLFGKGAAAVILKTSLRRTKSKLLARSVWGSKLGRWQFGTGIP